MRGSKYCFTHNPAAAKAKKAAVAKGGRNRRTPARATRPAAVVRIKGIADVQSLLYRSLEELRNGLIEAEIARAVGYLSGVAAKLHEAIELEERVAQLEATFEKLADDGGQR